MTFTGRDEDVTVTIGGDSSGLTQAVDDAKRSLGRFRKAVGITSAVLAGLGGSGIGASISAFADFDQAMQESIAVMGDVDAAMRERLEQTAREVATTTRQSHEEAAESFYFLASAGLDAQESIEAMPEVADFAAAGNMKMAEATDVATNVMSAYGFQAEEINKVTGTLSATVANHNQTMEGMSNAMAGVAPIAAELGLSIDETSTAIGMLGDVGIQGSKAGVQLRNVLSQLADPTSTASEQLKEMGVRVRDSQGDLLEFNEIIRNMQEGGVEGADAAELFGRRAGPAMAALLSQGGDAMENNTEKIADMENATERMAETQRDTLNAQLDIFRSRLNDIAVIVGETFEPKLRDLMGSVNDAATRFRGWLDTVDETRLSIGLIAGTVSSAVAAISALVSGPLGILIGAFSLVAAAWAKDLGGIRETVQEALGIIASLWKDHQDRVMGLIETVRGLLQNLRATFFEALGAVVDSLSKNEDEISSVVGGVIDIFSGLADAAEDVFENVAGFVDDNSAAIKDALNGAMTILTGVVDFIENSLLPAARFTFERVLIPIFQRVAQTVARNLSPLLGELGPTFRAIANYADTAGATIRSVWNRIDGVVIPIVKALANVLERTLVFAINHVSEGLQLAMNLIQGDFGEAAENLETMLTNLVDFSFDLVGILKNGISAAVSWLAGDGSKRAAELTGTFIGALARISAEMPFIIANGIAAAIKWVKNEGAPKLASLSLAIFNWLKRVAFDFPSIITGALQGAGDAIKSALGKLAGWIKDRVQTAISAAIKEALKGSDPSGFDPDIGFSTGGPILFPSRQMGGEVREGGMVEVHQGEQIVPADVTEGLDAGRTDPRAIARELSRVLNGLSLRVRTDDPTLDRVIEERAELVVDARDERQTNELRRLGRRS
jgi:TP901 family phage tail tape measure protein